MILGQVKIKRTATELKILTYAAIGFIGQRIESKKLKQYPLCGKPLNNQNN